MALERTLSIIKPDGVSKNLTGTIIAHFEKAGLKPVAMRMLRMSTEMAQGFYAVHKSRPFFGSLVTFMTSGPCLVMVLEGEDAIAKNRELMGATDPKKAAEGTLRKLYAADVENNAVHGSDGPDTARAEVAYFFRGTELMSR